MVTGDPLRAPTFILYGDPDYYFETYGPDLAVNDGFAWNHGGVAPEINRTFLGIVGPGVKAGGVESDLFTDHVDTRPTMLALLGLRDDYESQGRTIAEVLQPWVQPSGIQESGENFADLAHAYKLINAPTGPVGLAVLRISTRALKGDAETYSSLDAKIAQITETRNALAEQMSDELNAAEFHGHHISNTRAAALISAANALAEYVNSLAEEDE